MNRISIFGVLCLLLFPPNIWAVQPIYVPQIQPLQLQNPMEMYQRAEQIRALQLQNQQSEMQLRQMQEQERTRQERQLQQQTEERRRQSQASNQSDPVIDAWLQAAVPRMGLYPDFEQVVFAADVAITTDMIRLMTPSPLAADIAYYLGTHKMESLAISKMSLMEQARAIERIEGRLKEGKLPE